MVIIVKTILITGAASGIGAAITRRLASYETNLILHTKSNISGLESVADSAIKSGSNVSVLLNDLAQQKSAEDLIDHTIKTFGCIDQIVSNAGYAQRG